MSRKMYSIDARCCIRHESGIETDWILGSSVFFRHGVHDISFRSETTNLLVREVRMGHGPANLQKTFPAILTRGSTRSERVISSNQR